MSTITVRFFGWVVVVLSLMIGLLGVAPFTPAILLIAVLLPTAALVAWRGAVVQGLLSLVLCICALAVSPLRVAQLIDWPFAVAWLCFWAVAVLLGTVHGVRMRRG